MVKSIRCRLASERGFTLIELLVVMIIIAILMAVAIPMYLGQKQKALGTAAKENLKIVQDAIESCAAGSTAGTYVSPNLNCGDPAILLETEPATGALTGAGGGTSPCASGTCVTVSGVTDFGYSVASVTADGTPVTFTYTKTGDGTPEQRTCSGGDGTSMDRMCPNGTW
jgi:type IV pilus assembly protein PilA